MIAFSEIFTQTFTKVSPSRNVNLALPAKLFLQGFSSTGLLLAEAEGVGRSGSAGELDRERAAIVIIGLVDCCVRFWRLATACGINDLARRRLLGTPKGIFRGSTLFHPPKTLSVFEA